MADEPAPAAGSDQLLDDLERRVAAFDSATKRLQRNVDPASGAREAVVPVAAPPQLMATGGESSASRHAMVFGEDPSGLRPAVSTPAPVTGALTARRRSSEGGGASPGFTSAFGKPTIPVLPGAEPTTQPVPQTVLTTRRAQRPLPWWARRRSAVILGIAVVLLALAVLSRSFRELPSGEVWAETVRCQAPVGGVVASINVQVGGTIAAGAPLARIGETQVPTPRDGVVTRLLSSAGNRIAAGEPIAELALPATLRIIVGLPSAGYAKDGDRVSVRLLGEDRTIGGMVEHVFTQNEAGPGSDRSSAVARAVIVLDPSPVPPRIGRGAAVTLLGSDPGPLTQTMFALRRMLPW